MHPTGTHSTPKLAILRSKIEKTFSGEGAQPLPKPLSWGGDTTPHIPPTRGLRPLGFDHIPHQRFLDPPLRLAISSDC